MILSGKRIVELVKKGEIGIDPFDEKNLRDASYVFTLGDRISVQERAAFITAGSMPALKERTIPEDGFLLEPGMFVIGYTRERMRLGGGHSCLISTRGEMAHAGVNVTQSSFYAEPNTDWPIALEMSNQSAYPVKLTPGIGIAKGIFLQIV